MNQLLLSRQSYFISVLAHLLILIVGGLYFSNEITSVQMGDASAVMVQSYLADNNQFSSSRPLHENVETAKVKQKSRINKNEISLTKTINLSQANRRAESLSASASSRGESVEPLLAILHAAIQAKQQYPASAMEMEREGRVRIGFLLQPNGSIDQVSLVKSSGTSSLDAAGLQAVEAAAPFKGVSRYVSETREFQIDVVFALV